MDFDCIVRYMNRVIEVREKKEKDDDISSDRTLKDFNLEDIEDIGRFN